MADYNFYCDESCHLERDQHNVMLLGGVWCPKAKAHSIAEHLRAIKVRHGLISEFETKWTKVSPGKLDYYLELVDYFFDEQDLHFRTIIVPDKTKLHHDEFGQDHNLWYYKMYYQLLCHMIRPEHHYFIYLDIKDTCSGQGSHETSTGIVQQTS